MFTTARKGFPRRFFIWANYYIIKLYADSDCFLAMVLWRGDKRCFDRVEKLYYFFSQLFFYSFASENHTCSLETGHYQKAARSRCQENFRIYRFQSDFPRHRFSGPLFHDYFRDSIFYSGACFRIYIFCCLVNFALRDCRAFYFRDNSFALICLI